MSEQIDINLNVPPEIGRGERSTPQDAPPPPERGSTGTPPPIRGATPPPEQQGGINVGVTAQDQNFSSLTGNDSRVAEILNIMSILSDVSPIVRKVFLISRKVFQIHRNAAEALQKGSQLANRNMKLTEKSKSVSAQTDDPSRMIEDAASTKKFKIPTPLPVVIVGNQSTLSSPGNTQQAPVSIDGVKKVIIGKSGGGTGNTPPPIPRGRGGATPPPIPRGRGGATPPPLPPKGGGIMSKVGGMLGSKFMLLSKAAGVAGVAITLFAAGMKFASAQINAFINKIKDVSPDVQAAQAQAEVAETMAAIRESQKSGSAAAGVVESQSGFKIALMELQSSFTSIFGPYIERLIDIGSWLLKLAKWFLQLIKPVIDLLVIVADWIIWGINKIIDGLNVIYDLLGIEKMPKIEDEKIPPGDPMQRLWQVLGAGAAGQVPNQVFPPVGARQGMQGALGGALGGGGP